MLNFVWPWVFLLLPAPLLVYWGVPKATRDDAAVFVPFFAEVAGFAGQAQSGRLHFFRLLFLTAIWCLLVVALGRPQWIGDPVALPVSGRDLLVAVDISGSMGQEDMVIGNSQVSRITLVKKVLNEFLDRRTGDRVGLILFGTEAYIQAPLTFDRQTVKKLFNEAQIGFAGKKTSIGDAIGLAVKRLKERPADHRVLIMLTDGRNTAGNLQPLQAAELGARTGVTIYTIGVGADEIMVRDFFGTRRVNPSGDLDEDMLREIARLTDGRYFRARKSEELAEIYQMIDELEPVAQDNEIVRPVKALFHWPLAAALLVSFLAALLHIPFSFSVQRPGGR